MKIEEDFFHVPDNLQQRKYEALRAFYYERKPAITVADNFGYTLSSFYSMTRDFRKELNNGSAYRNFFAEPTHGRPKKTETDSVNRLIIELRKKYLSISEIKIIFDSKDIPVSESYIYMVLKRDGFERLPRRDKKTKIQATSALKVQAPRAELLDFSPETFATGSGGITCFLPYINKYGIDKIINSSAYPETKCMPKLNSILSFLALKLSSYSRYTKDDLWCMDRGLGFFAGLNVLPKAAWFTSYSHRVTRDINLDFLKRMNQLWKSQGLLSDTANLDFTAIPYWGDSAHLENNWSGKRNQALPSILAALSHDPESGIITYGNTNVRHKNESEIVLEFIDFYRIGEPSNLRYLVFDSKFTTYENLKRLDDKGIKFITIRRRGKKIVDTLENIPQGQWKKIRVETGSGRKRNIKVMDSIVKLNGYCGEIRQLAITGHGKIKPALIITNDFSLGVESVVRKYAKRWLVEKTISEQIYFFHLNKVSSSMVIKIDFDLTMTILAYNLYRLLAGDLEGYEACSPTTLFDKFVANSGKISIEQENIIIELKKKRALPALLTAMKQYQECNFQWLKKKKLFFRELRAHENLGVFKNRENPC